MTINPSGPLFSPEIKRADAQFAPPYTDGCPRCVDPELIFAPVVLFIVDDGAEAIYRHRTCGNEWTCCWGIWSDKMLEHRP